LDFRNAALGQTTPPWPEARVALEAALEAGTDASGQAFQATIELQQARADLATAQATIETFDHDGGIARLTKDLDDVKKSTKNRTMTKEEYDAHLEEQTKTLRDQLDAKDRAADSERATANEKISELTEEPDRLKANNDKLKKELDDLKKGYDDLKNEKDIIKKQNVILKKDNSDLTVLNDRIGELEADLEDAKSVSEDQTTKAECDERIKKETKRLQDEINRLQKQLEVCDAKNKLAIAQRESKISQLEADKGEHDAKISKYRLEITHKNQQIADLDRTVENMLTEAACASKNAEALAQKDKKIKDLEGGKVRLQQKISELQKDITDKHKDIAGLKASKQSLITEDDCAAKNKKALADKDKRITELEAVNQQLRSKAPSADWVPQGTHTERVNAVSARIADLEQRLHDPDAEVTRLGGELAGLNIQTAPLLPPAQIAQDNAEITRLTNELAACKAACDNEKKRLKTEIDRLNKKIAKNQSDYNSEYTRLNDEIEAKLYDYDDEENRLTKEIADLKKKLAGSKAKEQIIPTADPARVHSLLTRYLKDSTRAEIERLNDAIAIKEAACDAEKRILKDEITAHQCANDEQLRAEIAANKVDCDTEKNELSGQLVILQDENASFIRTRVADQTKICDMQKRIRYLQKQVDGDTNAAIKAKDAEIERLKGEIKSHQNTITTLETGKEDLNTRTDSQRFNSVTEHQNRRLRARIPALGIQIRTITGQGKSTSLENGNDTLTVILIDPPTPPSPTGSGDGSLAPLNNNYTPTTETNDFHILRIDIMLMGMVHKRAAYGFVKGDADVAMEAVNNAVQDAQTFRDSLPQDTPAREAELGRALYWQGLVAYYADQFNSAVTCFDQSDSLVWTHPDRSNLRGWIEWCQGVKRVDESAVSYMADKGENRRKRRPERRKKSRRPGPPPGTPSSETESEKIRRQFGSGT
jgi:chromosome segregation ATPase